MYILCTQSRISAVKIYYVVTGIGIGGWECNAPIETQHRGSAEFGRTFVARLVVEGGREGRRKGGREEGGGKARGIQCASHPTSIPRPPPSLLLTSFHFHD